MRALIVDDDYVSRSKLKALLVPYADCDAAPDGSIGLQLFQKAHEERCPYELITLDIDMPCMNGQEVLQQIRKWESEHKAYRDYKEAKVLMVTVRDAPEDIVFSFREGCEWYLIKPVNAEKLRSALNRLELLASTEEKVACSNA
ncbi:MAG TPA: response regulator [Thermoguttaceae bacterium]|nr:response regulator [Thermoguttaceae bacterium]HPP51450.1 response regulator [Thermoguttaceae bacterium]